MKGLLLDARTEKEPSPLSLAAGFQNSLVATPPPPISLFHFKTAFRFAQSSLARLATYAHWWISPTRLR